MTERTQAHDLAVVEGCPEEVTKEATVVAYRRMDAAQVALGNADELTVKAALADVAAYAYSAGRLARYDSLVKGQPPLIDLMHRGVHEFFHDEPFTQHDAQDCTDCLTVATIAADLGATYYVGPYNAVALAEMNAGDVFPDVAADDEDDDRWEDPEETVIPIVLPDTITERLPREDGPDPDARALHASAPGEWRELPDAPDPQFQYGRADTSDPA
jgi:hypothetical protein